MNNNKSVLKCGCARSLILPPGGSEGRTGITLVPPEQPKQIENSIELTSNIVSSVCVKIPYCCKPCIKLEFSSNIITTGFTGVLLFQVDKLCDNDLFPTFLSPTWQYSNIADTSSNTFSFFICDCEPCQNKHCTYTVRVGVLGPQTVGTVQINNASISAFAAYQDC